MRSSKTGIKEAICDSLCLLAQSKPKEKVSITSLIGAAGICRSSFYYHYESIDDVFADMVNEFCGEYQSIGFLVLNTKAHRDREGLLRAEEAFCDVILKYKKWVVFFFERGNYFDFREIFYQQFQERCRAMHITMLCKEQRSELRDRVTYSYSIYGCCMQMFACLELYVKRGFRETPEDFVSIYEQTFSQTLFFEEDISAV